MNHRFVSHEWFMRWEASGYTAPVLFGVASRVCSTQYATSLCISHLAFFSMRFLSVHVVHRYCSMDTATAWKKNVHLIGYCRSKNEIKSNILLRISAHGRASLCQPAKIYIHQLCTDTGCILEDLPKTIDDRDELWGISGNSVTLAWFDLFVWFGLVRCYSISIIVGYLMPNLLYIHILNIHDLVWLDFMAYQPL